MNLQKIYDDAINEKHEVFFEWFPEYEQEVNEYIEHAKNNSWTDDILRRLVYEENQVADQGQAPFSAAEY